MSIFSFAPFIGIFMFFVVPLILGNLFIKKDEYYFDGGFRYTTGIVTMMAVFLPFESVAIRRQISFERICNYYSIVIIFICLLSVLVFFRRKQYMRMFKNNILLFVWNNRGVLILFAIALFSTVRNMAFTRINYSDDATYTTAVNDILHTDRIFSLDIQTANWVPYYDISYKFKHMAIISFYAYASKVFGIHPTILIHTLSPLVWTPMVFIILWKITGELYRDSGDIAKRVLIISVVWLMLETWWSGWDTTLSLYFFSGIWWGKSVVQLIIIPAVVSLFLDMWGKKPKEQDYLLWLSVSMAANAASLMGPILVPFVIWGLNILYMIKKRTLDRVLLCIICVVPHAFTVIEALSEI